MLFISDGKCEYGIAWKKGNLPAEFAANELKKYVEQSTGCALEVNSVDALSLGKTFYIGFSRDEQSVIELSKTDLNGDGFIFDVTADALYLNAKTGRGLIFGVYDFLEKYFGVRFINMDCEIVPNVKDLTIPEGKTVERPEFAMRSYLSGKMLKGRGEEEHDIYHLKQRQCNEHRHLPERLGGECLMYGRNGTHNMHHFVPMEKYQETHPEFYAYFRNYITIDLLNGITDDGKLDQTKDVSVAKIVIEEMKKDIIANPDALYFQFEQEDSRTFKVYEEGSHEQELVDKYGRSGILIRFCNMLATELQEWSNRELGGRPINIVTFAYNYSKEPPVIKKEDGKYYPIDDTVVTVDNLIIRMAWWSNVAYSYFDDRQPAIAERIKGWHAVCHKFFFWAYDTDFTTFLWYFPSLHCIKDNILGFKNLGVEYLMFESSDGSLNDWQADLKCYIYSKLMWNTNLSVNDLYNEYLTHYFGAAGDYVKRCSAIMEHYSSFVESIYDNYWVATFEWTYRHVDLWNEKIFDRVLSILDDAENAIRKAGINVDYYLKHLACVRVTFLHMKVNKVNRALFENINLGGVTRFCGTLDIPEYKKQSFYNVEMLYRVVEPVIIPEEVKQKVNELDVYTISDQLDLDNVKRQFSRKNGEGIDDKDAFVLSDILDL